MTGSLVSTRIPSRDADSPGDALLRVAGVSRRFEGVTALADVSFAMSGDDVLAVLGPSGCGKSTLLRVIAGLETIDAGTVRLAGELLSAPDSSVPPERRGLGFVFQDYALFPHLSVIENVLFGIRGASSAATKRAEARRLLERVGLGGRVDAPVHVLSGGQQQRVALARSLATRPRLLLMDEPFSGLDVASRVSVRDETFAFLAEHGCPVIVVTHDPEEALEIATRVLVLSQGRVAHAGTPSSLLDVPATPFAAEFLCGSGNAFDAEAIGLGAYGLAGGAVTLHPIEAGPSLGEGARVRVVVRPEGVRIGMHAPPVDAAFYFGNPLTVVGAKRVRGAYRVTLSGPGLGDGFEGRVPSLVGSAGGEGALVGARVHVGVAAGSLHVFPY